MSLPPQICVALCPISTAPAELCWHPRQEIEAQDTPRVENKRIQGFLSHQKRFDKLLFTATVICAFRSVTVFSELCKQRARAHRPFQLTTKCKKSTKFKTEFCKVLSTLQTTSRAHRPFQPTTKCKKAQNSKLTHSA